MLFGVSLLPVISRWVVGNASHRSSRRGFSLRGIDAALRAAACVFRIGYGGCLTVGSDLAESIYSFLFRPGHRPLLPPWSEVTVPEVSRCLVTLRPSRILDVPLILSRRLAARLAEAGLGGFGYPIA